MRAVYQIKSDGPASYSRRDKKWERGVIYETDDMCLVVALQATSLFRVKLIGDLAAKPPVVATKPKKAPKAGEGTSAPSSPEKPAKAEMAEQRERDGGGQFAADDPATPGVNEAWKDGKAPAKKKRGRPPKKKGKHPSKK